MKTKIFYCYSSRMTKALVANGFVPIGTGTNKNSGTEYTMFEGTEALNDYKNNRYQMERDNFKEN